MNSFIVFPPRLLVLSARRTSGLWSERVGVSEQDLHRHQLGGPGLRYHLGLCEGELGQLESDGGKLHPLQKWNQQ